jgi:hypothetical protein
MFIMDDKDKWEFYKDKAGEWRWHRTVTLSVHQRKVTRTSLTVKKMLDVTVGKVNTCKRV